METLLSTFYTIIEQDKKKNQTKEYFRYALLLRLETKRDDLETEISRDLEMSQDNFFKIAKITVINIAYYIF